nr:MAG TPA: hypothetical protein [Caudoviricetes sp.]DAU78695.1 MAG TPA: hypothetical protein [Caudoviricetes sp.]DAV02601.1 MAG TPA: hypothetical protein [Bacteriophage sp.]
MTINNLFIIKVFIDYMLSINVILVPLKGSYKCQTLTNYYKS